MYIFTFFVNILIKHISEGLFLGSLDSCILLIYVSVFVATPCHAILIIITLPYSLRPGREITQTWGSLWNRLIGWSATLLQMVLRAFHLVCNMYILMVHNKHLLNKWLDGINEKEANDNMDMEFSRIWNFTSWCDQGIVEYSTKALCHFNFTCDVPPASRVWWLALTLKEHQVC